VSSFSGRDRAVARVAGAQKTWVSTQQLAACGLGKDAVAYRVLRLIKSAGLPCRTPT
jgi:hypothetical protein